jgi:hypothetical protein
MTNEEQESVLALARNLETIAKQLNETSKAVLAILKRVEFLEGIQVSAGYSFSPAGTAAKGDE